MARVPSNDDPGAEARPLGVLVADDEPSVRALLSAVLSRAGMRVWLAADGEEAVALHLANRDAVDVAVLDVRMPRLSGPEALARMRELRPGLPCVFMTGYAGAGGERALEGTVLPKPFAIDDVVAAVRRAAAAW